MPEPRSPAETVGEIRLLRQLSGLRRSDSLRRYLHRLRYHRLKAEPADKPPATSQPVAQAAD